MDDKIRIPVAEAFGTAVLVIGGPGTAIFATGTFNAGLSVGILGVSFAFGLSLLCMAYLLSLIHISEPTRPSKSSRMPSSA